MDKFLQEKTRITKLCKTVFSQKPIFFQNVENTRKNKEIELYYRLFISKKTKFNKYFNTLVKMNQYYQEERVTNIVPVDSPKRLKYELY